MIHVCVEHNIHHVMYSLDISDSVNEIKFESMSVTTTTLSIMKHSKFPPMGNILNLFPKYGKILKTCE